MTVPTLARGSRASLPKLTIKPFSGETPNEERPSFHSSSDDSNRCKELLSSIKVELVVIALLRYATVLSHV
ncbi:hypothetical protein EMCRGX_G016240 [Ephydatia muelleri]